MFLNFVFGAIIGFVANAILAAVLAGGDMINTQMGMSSAMIMDPSTKSQVSIMANFFSTSALLIFIYSGHPFNEFDTSRANITAPVSVDQYDENWVYLNTFHTMKEAQDITGISKVTIGLVVRGKQKMTGGYHWLRHGEQPPIININENKEEIENVI